MENVVVGYGNLRIVMLGEVTACVGGGTNEVSEAC
jgi:hypothetical protein